jgi:two-component system sensor histidine kinase TctE
MEAKLVPQLDAPVIVQVAETTKNRTALAHRILIFLAAGEFLLLIVITTLVVKAVDWGLQPLSELRRTVEMRNNAPDIDFSPLPTTSVPLEALSFVSAFNTLLHHVETSFQTLRRFTSDASHQLRAPLAVVRTHVELLSRNAVDAPEMRNALTDINLAVKALQHLITQLISLAKAERPQDNEHDAGVFDLVECTAGVARGYAGRALDRAMEMAFEADQEHAYVRGNALFAGEMIANLLDNAIRYGRSGGQILIRVIGLSGRVEIQDNGPGIPASERERVFERFHRLPQSAEVEGSGLGLSIVRALGRRMCATVTLEDGDNGVGTKAVVRFHHLTAGDTRLLPAPEKLGANQAVQI